MINYLLRKELTERQKWREHATEAAEISDYCRDEAITAATTKIKSLKPTEIEVLRISTVMLLLWRKS